MSVTRAAVPILQVVLVVVAGPLLIGVIRKVRARLEGRVGAPIHQPLRDLRKLLTKERLLPEHASWVFALAPAVLVSSAVATAALVPLVSTVSPFAHVSDLVTITALLLLGTVALALGALDPGTAFGGMGSSREMTIAALTEPTLLLSIAAISILAGTTNLPAVVASTLHRPEAVISIGYLLAIVALAIATLAESARLPVDNPNTHLELTMVHEAMVLEYAGPDLALVESGSSIRLAIFLGLLANLLVPWGIATTPSVARLALGTLAFVGKISLLAILLGVFEVFTAKIRLFRVPELLALSLVLSFLAVIIAVVHR
jgi:formate hydrogenlyase subunit 4